MLEVNSFTPDLLKFNPFALKRCLRSEKILKLLIKCTEWSAHANKSHLFSASNLLNLSSPPLTCGTGPLMFNNPMKFRFRTSDCCLDTSFDPVSRTMFVTDGYCQQRCRNDYYMQELRKTNKVYSKNKRAGQGPRTRLSWISKY